MPLRKRPAARSDMSASLRPAARYHRWCDTPREDSPRYVDLPRDKVRPAGRSTLAAYLRSGHKDWWMANFPQARQLKQWFGWPARADAGPARASVLWRGWRGSCCRLEVAQFVFAGI